MSDSSVVLSPRPPLMLHPATRGPASCENQLSWLPHRLKGRWGLCRNGMMPGKRLANVCHCKFRKKRGLRALAYFEKGLFQRS